MFVINDLLTTNVEVSYHSKKVLFGSFKEAIISKMPV